MRNPSSIEAIPASKASEFDPRSYWEQRLSQHEGLKGVGYTLLGKQFNEWQYRLRRLIFLREMRALRLNWQSVRVLDIGSGTGFYIGLWKELGVHSITGYDLTEVAVSRLKKVFSDCSFRRVDITEPLTESAAYDVVSAFDVFFHIVDSKGFEQALENIYAILKPGGLFVFSELFVHGAENVARHQVSRSLAEIEALVKKSGFHVERRVPMFVIMNIPLDSSSRIPSFAWNLFSRLISRSEVLGYIAGAILFCVDWLLTRLLRESPTTELMICKK